MLRQISVEEYQFPEFGALVRVHVNLEGAAGLSEDALVEALVKHFTLEINDKYLADGGHALQRVPGLEHALKDLAPDARAPGPLPCDFSVDALRACVRNSVEARLTNTDGVTGTLSERVTHRGITRLLRYVSVLRAAHPSFARHKRGRLPRTREDHTQLDELRSALRRRDWTRARAILERTGALAAGAARVSLVSPEEEDEEEDGEAEEAFSSGGVDGGRPYRLHLETEDLMRALRWRAEPTDAETLGPVAQVKRKAGDERCVPRDIMLALLAAGGRKVLEDVDWGEYVRSKLENETGDARPAEEDEEDAPRAAFPLHAAVAHPAHPPEVLRFILELSPIQLLRAKNPSRDTALHALLADVGAKRNVEMRRKPWREGLAAKVDVFVKAAAAAGLAGAVVRARNRDGETPVHVAARALNPHGPGGRAHCGPVNEDEAGAVMRKLLEDDPEAALCVDAGGRTPLLVAVCKCDSTSLGVVLVLLARAPRAATMTETPLGFQLPLQAELDKPHVKPAVVRALVRRGDDCAVKLDSIRRSPLHALLAEASRVGQDGARRTWPRRDEPRMSFFHRRGEVFRSLVRDFLARDVAYPSVDGPLGQRYPAAETVLAIRDSSGRTPLMYAVRHPEATVQMLKKLIAAHPAALDVADDEGNLPLHVAAGTGDKDPFALILRHRPDHIRAQEHARDPPAARRRGEPPDERRVFRRGGRRRLGRGGARRRGRPASPAPPRRASLEPDAERSRGRTRSERRGAAGAARAGPGPDVPRGDSRRRRPREAARGLPPGRKRGEGVVERAAAGGAAGRRGERAKQLRPGGSGGSGGASGARRERGGVRGREGAPAFARGVGARTDAKRGGSRDASSERFLRPRRRRRRRRSLPCRRVRGHSRRRPGRRGASDPARRGDARERERAPARGGGCSRGPAGVGVPDRPVALPRAGVGGRREDVRARQDPEVAPGEPPERAVADVEVPGDGRGGERSNAQGDAGADEGDRRGGAREIDRDEGNRREGRGAREGRGRRGPGRARRERRRRGGERGGGGRPRGASRGAGRTERGGAAREAPADASAGEETAVGAKETRLVKCFLLERKARGVCEFFLLSRVMK
jgi:ankyrin repeat protein